MPEEGSVVVIGGTAGLGLAIARAYAERGANVVVTGRDAGRANAAAADLGPNATGIAFDLAEPAAIAPAIAGLGPVRHLVLGAIERDDNAARSYDIGRALRLVTLKLVGYSEVAHALCDRMNDESSIVVFGGRAKDRPYVGSMTITTVNAGITGLVRALAVELAPIRVNAIHPGIVGDSPYWSAKPDAVLDAIRARTPTHRLASTADVVSAVTLLLENRSVNGVELYVDGGWLLT
jgi:NAD(P)-dependent dehydrogenase (short-subunit alcohol dehydrogenase family)